MPTEEDVIRIQLEIEDAEKADDLRAAIGLLEQKLGALYSQFKGYPEDFRNATAQDAARLAEMRAQLDEVANSAQRRADAEKQAARDARDAKVQAARDAVAAAKRAAQEEVQAARSAAEQIIDEANREMAARNRAADSVGSASERGAIGVRGLAYALDDAKQFSQGFAAGIMAISNNIQPVLEGFKATAGIAPYLAIAGTAVTLLAGQWDSLMRLTYGGFKPDLGGLETMESELKKLQKTMEELGEQTSLTFAELQKFNETKSKVKVLIENVKSQRAVDSSLEGMSGGEKSLAQGFQKAIDETGPSALNDYKAALESQKDASGKVYNFKDGTNTSVADAARDNWAAALKGNRQAIDAIGGSFEKGNLFRSNIEKFGPGQEERDKAFAKDVEDDRGERTDRANAADKARLDAEYKAFQSEEEADRKAQELSPHGRMPNSITSISFLAVPSQIVSAIV